jgi:hypothetical protein
VNYKIVGYSMEVGSIDITGDFVLEMPKDAQILSATWRSVEIKEDPDRLYWEVVVSAIVNLEAPSEGRKFVLYDDNQSLLDHPRALRFIGSIDPLCQPDFYPEPINRLMHVFEVVGEVHYILRTEKKREPNPPPTGLPS